MHIRKGFSLIEILIAVTVLALGLLGLAAVFPVVVGQQRDASNAAAGEAVTSSVRAYLESYSVLENPQRGWAVLNNDIGTTARRWVDLRDPSNNAITWASSPPGGEISIPLSQRLWPSGANVRPGGPRFVWDMAAFAPDADGPDFFDDERVVRVAIFLRPVDTNIRDRGDRDATAWDLIDAGTRVPVAMDGDGVPTRTGVGDYADFISFEVEDVYDYRAEKVWEEGDTADAILVGAVVNSFSGSTRQVEALLNKPGQRFIDRQGNVYRITSSKRVGTDTLLRIDPPISPRLAEQTGSADSFEADDLGPLLASPVAPVADPIFLEIRP